MQLRLAESLDGPINDIRYRSKVVEIDAIQWTGDNTEEVEEFTVVRRTFEHNSDGEVSCFRHEPPAAGFIWNELNQAWRKMNFGDFIIRGMRGDYYSCDPSAFQEVYEPVREGERPLSGSDLTRKPPILHRGHSR